MAFKFSKKKKGNGLSRDLPDVSEIDLELPELPPLPDLSEEEFKPEPIRPIPTAPRAPRPIPSLPKVSDVTGKAPVFIKLEKYQDTIMTIEKMQAKVEELQRTLEKISAIKQKEHEIISGWNALLAEAKSKIQEINENLLKP